MKGLGYKLEIFNESATDDRAKPQVREAAVDIMVNILDFLQQVVKMFRDPFFGV